MYVELENTPWVWRLQPDGGVQAHDGEPVAVRSSLLDEEGRLYLDTDRGIGLVHTADMALAADAVEAGRWQPEAVRVDELPARYGFVRSPEAMKKAGH